MHTPVISGRVLPLLIVLATILTAPQTGGAADSPKNIWSTTPHFTVIKSSKAPLENFSLFINGSPAEKPMATAAKHNESLHVSFSLAYGKQTAIEVRDGRQTVFAANIFFAPSYEKALVPEGSSYIPFHTQSNEARCQGCHRFTIKQSDFSPGVQTQTQVCFTCHNRDYDGKQSKHKPAAIEWRCLSCHQPEAKESPWSKEQPLRFTVADTGEIAALCFSCHQKVQAQAEHLPFVHGPIGMGVCNQCHDPHASNWPKLLENDCNTLCVNCHEMQSILEQPVIHGAIRSKGCIACHNPHASTHPLQMNNTGNDLCLSCHQAIKQLGNNHPVQGHPVSIKTIDRKTKKERLSCLSCHSPHASENPSLLEEEEVMNLCVRCHDTGRK